MRKALREAERKKCLNEGGITYVGDSNRPRLSPFPVRTFEASFVCPALSPLAVLGACHDPPDDGMQRALLNHSRNAPNTTIVHVGHYFVGNELSWLDPKTPGLAALATRYQAKVNPTAVAHKGGRTRHMADLLLRGVGWEQALAMYGVSYRRPAVSGLLNPYDAELVARGHGASLRACASYPFSAASCAIKGETAFTGPSRNSTARSTDAPGVVAQASVQAATLARLNAQWGDLRTNWGPFYEALGKRSVTRVTMLRSPWSQLASLFCWGRHAKRNFSCTNPHHVDLWAGLPLRNTSIDKEVVLRMCGVDCEARFLAGAPVEVLLKQAAYNLRHSFAIVGVLEKFDGFVQAVRRLSPHLRQFSEKHAHQLPRDRTLQNKPYRHGRPCPEAERKIARACLAYWMDERNQRAGIKKSHVIKQLTRMYDIALELASK